MDWKKLEVDLTLDGLPQLQDFACLYTTSYFYHSVGLQPLCTQSSNKAWILALNTAQKLANSAWILALNTAQKLHEFVELGLCCEIIVLNENHVYEKKKKEINCIISH